MNLQTKAIYNLLRLNAQESSEADVEPWMIEDLRAISAEELFQRLESQGISLDKNSFVSFAHECDTPEDLADLLLDEEIPVKQHDLVYLVLFELWRRIMPERQSLSIFCDELDHRISLYDQGVLESDEPIQDILANLQEILDENQDEGQKPLEIFRAISEYCAHDLDGFLYDYISELLDGGDVGYALELIEDFFPFLPDSIWTQFLRARALSFSDVSKANAEVARILDEHPENETPFLFETLRFLSVSGDHRLFIAVIQKIIAQLQTEEEFEELMEIAADYYRRLDQDEIEMAIERLMKKRSTKTFAFDPSDPDLKAFARSLK